MKSFEKYFMKKNYAHVEELDDKLAEEFFDLIKQDFEKMNLNDDDLILSIKNHYQNVINSYSYREFELKEERDNLLKRIDKLTIQNRDLIKNIDHKKTIAEKFKKLSENRLSLILKKENQFLYENKKSKDLNESYKKIRTDLFQLQRTRLNLISKLDDEKKSIEEYKKQKIYLEKLVKSYKARRVVKVADKTKKIFIIIKSYLKNLLSYKESPIEIIIENKKLSENSKDKNNDIEPKLSTLSPKNKPKNLKDIKIAVILDEFSYNSYKHEFNAITFDPSNWFEIFETEKPELFLCESAWSGGPWQGKIQFDVNTKTENRTDLLKILDYCNKKQITTIFWNKEDPTNFEKFFDTAIKFDHIFTTSEECIPKYRKELGHNSVHSLMFAAQPKLFNPIETQ